MYVRVCAWINNSLENSCSGVRESRLSKPAEISVCVCVCAHVLTWVCVRARRSSHGCVCVCNNSLENSCSGVEVGVRESRLS